MKAIIFDLWGTLAYTEPFIGEVIEKINELINEKEVFTKLRRNWYTEYLTTEGFFEKLAKEIKLDEKTRIRVIEIWDSQIKNARLYPETIETLEELKTKNIKLILISNTTPIGEQKVKKLQIEKYFDLILYSFREGITKPHKKIFEIVLEKLKLNPDDIFIIGDQLDTDKKGADSINAKFILIDRNNKYDFKPKIQSLKEIQKYIN
ncbi:HAD family hydrolase [Candidatus Woesearchaeota archaeon]|nr:HAD family hydrolase [Candidatus Woesearchaeota archaeon]